MNNTKRLVSALLSAAMVLPCFGAYAEDAPGLTKTVELTPDNVVYGRNYVASVSPNDKHIKLHVNSIDSAEAYLNFSFAGFENIPNVDAITGIDFESTHGVSISRGNGSFWFATELPEQMPEDGDYIALEKNAENKYEVYDSEAVKTVIPFFEYVATYTDLNRNWALSDDAYEELSEYIGGSEIVSLSSDKKLVIKNPNISKNYGGRMFNFIFNSDGTHSMPVDNLTATNTQVTQTIRFKLTDKKACNITGAWDSGVTVIEALQAAKKEDGSADLAFIMHGGSNTNNNFKTSKLYVTYDIKKLFEIDLKNASSAADISETVMEYNDYINADLNALSDMSEAWEELYSWKSEADEADFTFSKVKEQFDLITGNLVVKYSFVSYGTTGEYSDVTAGGLSYTFNDGKEYTSEDTYSVYFGFNVKDIESTMTVSAGGVSVTIDSDAGKITLSAGDEEQTADISPDFDGYVAIKLLKDKGVSVTASNESERTVLSVSPENFAYSAGGVSVTAEDGGKFGELSVQQYTDNFEKSATEKLDAVMSLLTEQKRQEAIDSFDSAKTEAEQMSDGIAKNELNMYIMMLSAKIEYAKQEQNKANAEEAIAKALNSKKYEDLTAAAELVELVTDEELSADVKAKLMAAEAEFAKILPLITSVVIEGVWKTGNTLTAKITMEDNCGNGDGYELMWLVNGAESNETGESFKVLNSHAGKKIVLRAYPKNKNGAKGEPKESLPARIQSVITGGGGGGGTGGGGGRGSSGNIGASVSLGSATSPTEPVKSEEKTEPSFKDISGHWAEETINNMMKKNIIKGISEDEFAPDKNITKAEFAAIILRALNKETKKYAGEFEDVSASDWYADTVAAAYKLGLVSGSEGLFNPNSNITRQEMAKILVVAYEIKNGEIKAEENAAYTDFSDISDWAKDFINKAFAAELMKGDDSGRFNPSAGATRAEAATAVERFINK